MPHAALRHFERLLAKDPVLRDALAAALPRGAGGARFVPDVEVLDCGDHFLVRMDLPGVARASVRVRLDGGRIQVSGARAIDRPDGARVRTNERAEGSFEREFLLPADVDGAGVRARLVDGVLSVTVPRRAGARARDVDVDV